MVIRGVRLGQPTLMESLASGCVPVIVSDSYILPYSEVIDWRRAVLQIYEDDLDQMMELLRSVSFDRISEMRKTGSWIYTKYFSSMENVALTTLRIINDRVFPHQGRSYSDWNEEPTEAQHMTLKTFTLPIGPPRSQGFTAVVLTYDRIESLFRVIERISKAPSLAKIVVIWNNQMKDPPGISSWPRLSKPLEVLHFQVTQQTQCNNIFCYKDHQNQKKSTEQPLLSSSGN